MKLCRSLKVLALVGMGIIGGGSLTAQTLKTLYSFTATSGTDPGPYTNNDGANPDGALVLAGATLYGTTSAGGTYGNGVVYSIAVDGSNYSILHTFTDASLGTNYDGATPTAGLVVSGNTLYGTTFSGGVYGRGTVFAIHTDGTGFTNLHDFSGTASSNPNAALVLAGDVLYGTTYRNYGSIFALHTDGTDFTTVFSFGPSTGVNPAGKLTVSGGTLYGTASTASADNCIT